MKKIIVMLLLVIGLSACSSLIESTETQSVEMPACIPSEEPQTAKVTYITDGDTIHVEMNGQDYKVRYIGMNAPEMNDRPWGEHAKEKNAELVEGTEVQLYKDVSETDKYGRLLRYVMIGDTFVNYELVRQGYAYSGTYPPDLSCSDYFREAQNAAEDEQAGLWGN